jgi:hypothetical protein
VRVRLDEALVFAFCEGSDASGIHSNSSSASAPTANEIDGTHGPKLRSPHRTGTLDLVLRDASHVQGVGEPVVLGPPTPCRLDVPIAVSVAELVPTNHFYRHLDAKLTCRLPGSGCANSLSTDAGPRSTESSSSSAGGHILRKHSLWTESIATEP